MTRLKFLGQRDDYDDKGYKGIKGNKIGQNYWQKHSASQNVTK